MHHLKESLPQIKETLCATAKAVAADFKEIKYCAEDASEKAVQATRDAAEKTKLAVENNPWKTIGVVAGATAIVGFLIGRKSS